jgi:hypothetical protein
MDMIFAGLRRVPDNKLWSLNPVVGGTVFARFNRGGSAPGLSCEAPRSCHSRWPPIPTSGPGALSAASRPGRTPSNLQAGSFGHRVWGPARDPLRGNSRSPAPAGHRQRIQQGEPFVVLLTQRTHCFAISRVILSEYLAEFFRRYLAHVHTDRFGSPECSSETARNPGSRRREIQICRFFPICTLSISSRVNISPDRS